MGVKLLEIAKNKYGTVSTLQKALFRHGAEISQQAIAQAIDKKTQSIRLDVLSAIVDLVFNGDWKAAGKVIDSEFASKTSNKG